MKKILGLLACLVCFSCSSGSSTGSGDSTGGADDSSTRAELLASVNDWAYWIDGPDLSELTASDYDLVVIDYSADGSVDEEFTAEQIQELKDSGKVVLAYMSIGEAEDYRFYFDPTWIDGAGELTAEAPDFLDEANPDWPGNYKAHYWEADWQAVIFGTDSGADESYLDRIMDMGFDGVYLDIIDAYEYFGPGGDSGLDRASAGTDMIDFVIAIADYARNTRGDENFLIFPQNGAAILDEDATGAYLDTVDGIGAEDTFYFGEEDNNNDLDLDNAAEVTAYLDQFVAADKVVLSVDYVQDPDKVSDFYDRASTQGYLPYATVRDLNQLIINDGFEPD